MATIQRYNTVLDVEDSEVEYYLNLGYSLIDNKGNVVKKAMSNDVHTLQKELVDANNTIASLKAEIDALKLQIVTLKSEKSAEVKATTNEKPSGRRKKAVEE